MSEDLPVNAAWSTDTHRPVAQPRIGVVSPRLEFAVTLAPSLVQGLHIALSATRVEQAPAVLASCTHVVVDLYIVDDVQSLTDLLRDSVAQVILVVPDDLVEAQRTAVQQVPGVHRCVQEADLTTALASLQVAGNAGGEPNRTVVAVPPTPVSPIAGRTVGGWRGVAVWSLEGGVGKTRITRALGLDCVRHGGRALVIGLGAPDALPLQAGLHPEPNLIQWQQDPRAEVLAELVQADGNLDLVAGFLSPLALGRFAADALEGDTSLGRLAMQTAHLGYAAVLLDVSAQELAAPALQAANTLILVCSATPQGTVAAVEAYRLARHEIGLAPANCHLVISRHQADQLTLPQFLGTVRSVIRDIPEPIGVLPEDNGGGARRPATPGTVWGSEAWRSALREVGTCIWGSDGTTPDSAHREEQETRLGPLVIKRG